MPRRLVDTDRAILVELDRLGQHGGLTGNVSRALFGDRASSGRVRRPCMEMARAGLVERHPQNDQRWFITAAGRAALERGAAA